jgi:hypothetical protein
MPKEHCWKDKTEEGLRREVRAVRHGTKWRIQTRTEDRQQWTYHDQASLADLEYLHDLVNRKYQRRRASWDEVEEVTAMLKEAQGA